MYLIVVGAGAEGKRLIDLAIKQGHRVSLIEQNEQNARAVLQEHDIQVFHADIAAGGILDEADAKHADAIIATTHDDATNLMTMMLGQEYGIAMRVSLLNDANHKNLFEKLNVHVISDPATIVAQRLYSLVTDQCSA